MLLPIKIKDNTMYSFFLKTNYGLRGLISNNESSFNKSISIIRIGKYFKTSFFNRFSETEKFLYSYKKKFNKICDIGASDGSGSYGFIKSLNYNKYYLIDKYINLKINEEGNNIYLYDSALNLHMLETKNFVIYLDPLKKNFNIFNSFIDLFFNKKKLGKLKDIQCINPLIKKNNKNINVIEADLMIDFDINMKFDLIIVENLINKIHHEDKLLRNFKKNIVKMISNEGLVILGENNSKEKENATIYTYKKKFMIIHKIGNGSISEGYLNL